MVRRFFLCSLYRSESTIVSTLLSFAPNKKRFLSLLSIAPNINDFSSLLSRIIAWLFSRIVAWLPSLASSHGFSLASSLGFFLASSHGFSLASSLGFLLARHLFYRSVLGKIYIPSLSHSSVFLFFYDRTVIVTHLLYSLGGPEGLA